MSKEERPLIFTDTESTGFSEDPNAQMFELSWAFETGPIRTLYFDVATPPNEFVDNLTKYTERGVADLPKASISQLREFMAETNDATIVAANPSHDKHFLVKEGLWKFHYRMLDVESYAMKALGTKYVPGMRDIYDTLRQKEYRLPEPDHSSAGDVATMRAAFLILRDFYPID